MQYRGEGIRICTSVQISLADAEHVPSLSPARVQSVILNCIPVIIKSLLLLFQARIVYPPLIIYSHCHPDIV